MTDLTRYKNIEIHYNLSGEGDTLLLLHGFLENKEMWQFAHNEYSKTHQVLSIDLLGHGKTACLESEHSMLEIAKVVKAVCDHLKIEKAHLVGHSMGGYVALEMAKHYPHLLSGICLMNSNYFADSEEKIKVRKRANEMAKTQFSNLVRMSFMNLFAPSSKEVLIEDILLVLDQALQPPIQGYIKTQEGMISREDYSVFFANLQISKMIILGEKDPVMPAKPIVEFCNQYQIVCRLLDKGHMSHIENKTGLINYLWEFLKLEKP